MDMGIAVQNSGNPTPVPSVVFDVRRNLHLASREVTKRGFYARLRLLLTGEVEGNLDIDLYNSKRAAAAWVTFNNKGRVTSPEETEVLPELLSRNADKLRGSTSFIEGGPGDAFGKIIQMLVATEALQYTAFESSAFLRAKILAELKTHLIDAGRKDIADRLAINVQAHDFNEPQTAVQSPGATLAVLGGSISNVFSEPGGKVPYDKLVEIIGNYIRAIGNDGTLLLTTDAHDDPVNIKGKDFARAYYDPDFMVAYHDLVDRMVKEFGMEVIDPATGSKLDHRILKPAFDWEGEEIHAGAGGHKVAHKIMALNNTADLTGPDDVRQTRDVILRFPRFDDFDAFEVRVPAGKGIVALNSIKWPTRIMHMAIDDAGANLDDTVQSQLNFRSTGILATAGNGGKAHRRTANHAATLS